jgi:hypothetical protein
VLPQVSETRITELLSDHDTEGKYCTISLSLYVNVLRLGIEQIQDDGLKKIIRFLLVENDKEENENNNEFLVSCIMLFYQKDFLS